MKKVKIIIGCVAVVVIGAIIAYNNRFANDFEEYASHYNVKTVEQRLEDPETNMSIDEDALIRIIDYCIDYAENHSTEYRKGHSDAYTFHYSAKRLARDLYGFMPNNNYHKAFIRGGDIIRIYYKRQDFKNNQYCLNGVDMYAGAFTDKDDIERGFCEYGTMGETTIKIVAYDLEGKEFYSRELILDNKINWDYL